MNRRRPIACLCALGVLLLIGGCTAGLLESDRQPVRIYTLAPPSGNATPVENAPRVGLAGVESAPGLDTDRMLLRRDALRLDHFAGARWAADTPALVEDYLAAALLAGAESFRLAGMYETADYELDLEIRSFEADYRGGEPPVVRVDLVAVLRDDLEGRRVMLTHLSAAKTATDNTLGSVAEAFDAAMEEIASAIVGEIDKAIASEAADAGGA